ncbi:hypothetical protein L2E82_33568 [Cichorium intybus]|uniref:Uncharacterized protein n=2 Tax=Cichorium intybus TaxID=13427 RepID=A0ACB9BKW1_CICIN|nr:hypothetical protein L2E82_39603 [Cichorium intybus]KAI3722529.1 hypothetical protein L2E82_33568 [Cichorium intybus]
MEPSPIHPIRPDPIEFLVISGCKEFSPTNNTHCNRRLYIASCLRLSVPVPSCRTQISLKYFDLDLNLDLMKIQFRWTI